MVASQIYIGRTPETASERSVVRERALELNELLRRAHQPEHTVLVLEFAASDDGPAQPVNLLLLREAAMIVGLVRSYREPIAAHPGTAWTTLGGAPLVEHGGLTPLDVARLQRDALLSRLRAAEPIGLPLTARMLAAVICSPALHPESRVSLDVDDHRQGLKIFGLNELPGVAAMARGGFQLTPERRVMIATDLLGARLWFDNGRQRFELAPARFQLRLLDGDRSGEAVPLYEGVTVVGRRRTPHRFERRFTIVGDDLISSDHAVLRYGDGDSVTVRDASKNGTWVLPAEQTEQHLRGGERTIVPGTMLRMGLTRMALERATNP